VSLVGFAVAGGGSSRMGRDKALLPFEATDLLGHALRRLGAVTGDVRILCGPEPRYADRGRPLVTDLARGAGPLGGVVAGLAAAEGGSGLFLAVDLPDVPVALLERLASLAPGWDAVVPSSPSGLEPLCAVYAPACLEPGRHLLAAGRNAMTGLVASVRARVVPASEIAAFGDPDRLFRNLNAPSDLDPAGA
jgi:molybdopterin-guanine dinucleotide biosynthesis protein A